MGQTGRQRVATCGLERAYNAEAPNGPTGKFKPCGHPIRSEIEFKASAIRRQPPVAKIDRKQHRRPTHSGQRLSQRELSHGNVVYRCRRKFTHDRDTFDRSQDRVVVAGQGILP